MTIKVFDRYGPRANPADANYPNGSYKNESVPGANDGTPLEVAQANDMQGFTDALLTEAGIVANGVPDTAVSSQRLTALNTVVDKKGSQLFRRAATVAQIENGDFPVDSRLTVTDRADAPFNVVSGGTANGSDVLNAGNGNAAELQMFGVVNILHLGAKVGAFDSYPQFLRAAEITKDNEGGTILAPFTMLGYSTSSSFSIKKNTTFDACDSFINTLAGGSYDTSGGLIVGGDLSSEPLSPEPHDNITITRVRIKTPTGADRPLLLSNACNSEIKDSYVEDSANAFFVRYGFGNTIKGCESKNLQFQCIGTGGQSGDAELTGDLVVDDCRADGGSLMVDARSLGAVTITNCRPYGHSLFAKVESRGKAVIQHNVGVFVDRGQPDNIVKIDSDGFDVSHNDFTHEGAYPCILFNDGANSAIVQSNKFRTAESGAGIIRFLNGDYRNIQLKDNEIYCDKITNYMIRVENDATLTDSQLNGNIIEHGAEQTNPSSFSSVFYLPNCENVDVKHNQITVNKAPMGNANQRAMTTASSSSSVYFESNTILGDGNTAVDMRGCNDSSVVLNKIECTSTPIQLTAGDNTLRGQNKENGVWSDLTSVVI